MGREFLPARLGVITSRNCFKHIHMLTKRLHYFCLSKNRRAPVQALSIARI